MHLLESTFRLENYGVLGDGPVRTSLPPQITPGGGLFDDNILVHS